MKNVLVLFGTVFVLAVLLGIGNQLAYAQTGDVEFRVNMRVKMLEGTFLPGSGDKVLVRGGFNGWGTPDTLTDPNNDSIYTKILTIATGPIEYKFFKTLRGGLDWENVPNRQYTVVSGSQQLPVVYFDNDSIVNPPTVDVPVTFQVNMRVKILEGTFLPGSGDIVTVPGSMNGWNNAADTLRDPNNDSIYTKTLQIAEGAQIFYKYYKTPRGGLDWEGDPNREYTVPTGGGVIPVVYFNRDSVVNTPITANILWQSDMTAFEQLGWFRPDLGDTMQVRGGFNGWSASSIMSRNPFTPTLYELVVPYSGTSFDEIPHKYFIDMDSASALTRFPDFLSDRDGHEYEHPYHRGDGNRIFNVGNGGNIETPLYWFSSIHPNGVLLNTTDSVTVRFRVNMGPATREAATPFNYATDTAKFEFMDPLQLSNQRRIQGTSYAKVRTMTRLGPTDSVYQVSVTIVGKAHYGLLYRYLYAQPGGNIVSEGAGLGAQNGYRSRYIQPTAPNTFPRNYNAPQEGWQKNPPLVAETPPFSPLVGVFSDKIVPLAYRLMQNYPNPFNPTTTIRFSVERVERARLTVYNLLGQEVVTLFDGIAEPGREYIVPFEASNLATGVYFYRLHAGSFNQVKKMLLLK